MEKSETVVFIPVKSSGLKKSKQGFLTVIKGGDSDLGKSALIEAEIEVGRKSQHGLTLVDTMVSSHHLMVFRKTNNRYFIEDLGSTNGTMVNRKPIKKVTELKDGDKIFIGQTVLRFSMADNDDLDFHHKLTQLIHIDPLTGMEAKHCFDHALLVAIGNIRRTNNFLSVLMMDMDGLKKINDRHGHLFGAYTISETGKLISRVLKNRGSACRFGGDEFTAMLPGLNKQEAVNVGEEIRRELENAGLKKEGIRLSPTISIGVACLPDDGESLMALIDAADQALYRAKRGGKNRVSI